MDFFVRLCLPTSCLSDSLATIAIPISPKYLWPTCSSSSRFLTRTSIFVLSQGTPHGSLHSTLCGCDTAMSCRRLKLLLVVFMTCTPERPCISAEKTQEGQLSVTWRASEGYFTLQLYRRRLSAVRHRPRLANDPWSSPRINGSPHRLAETAGAFACKIFSYNCS